MSFKVGVDTGGTFTDLVALDTRSGAVRTLKVPTTVDAPARGVMEGLAGLGVEIGFIAHGTTIVTNAIVEGKGAVTALVATRGFRDILEIGRQGRVELYRLDVPPKPAPLIPRHLRFEVGERIAADGAVLTPLDVTELPALAESLAAQGVEAVAACLLNSYVDPAHEAQVAEALAASIDYVSPSYQVNAEFREYERTATTALNAMVMPLADRYLGDLEASIEREGIAGPLRILQSNGGMLSARAVRDRPLAMAVSGPAGGVAASTHLVRALGLRNAIAFDMGGTTTDVCLIADRVAQSLSQRRIGGYPVRFPSVGVESVGSGGGSIAWFDDAGALHVGPRSAGAHPGPACYGRGGAEATVTDAHLVAGTLRGDATLGESIRMDGAAAAEVLAPVAARLGLGAREAAAGVLEVANATMLRALRLISVQRGFDLRDFTLIAYGGAGPLHAGRLAAELGMPRVVVPANAGVFSAFGCVVTEIVHDLVQTSRADLGDLDDAAIEARFAPLGEAVIRPLEDEGRPLEEITVERAVDLRYAGQNYEIEVPWRGTVAALEADFEATHQRLFSYATGDPLVCVNLRAKARLPAEDVPLPEWASAGSGEPFAEQAAYFAQAGEAAMRIYRREDLPPEQPVKGPALIEDPWSTTLVYPGQTGRLDPHGNLMIELDSP